MGSYGMRGWGGIYPGAVQPPIPNDWTPTYHAMQTMFGSGAGAPPGRNPGGKQLDNRPRCAYCGKRRKDDGTTCPGCGAREVK
jgi:hypothetical protein